MSRALSCDKNGHIGRGRGCWGVSTVYVAQNCSLYSGSELEKHRHPSQFSRLGTKRLLNLTQQPTHPSFLPSLCLPVFFPLSRWTVFSGTSPSLPHALAPSSVSLLSFQLLSCLCPTSPPVLPSAPTPPCFWVSPHILFPLLSWLHPLFFYPTPQQRNISVFGIPPPSFSLSHAQKWPIL